MFESKPLKSWILVRRLASVASCRALARVVRLLVWRCMACTTVLRMLTPDLPTKIIPTKIRWLKLSGKFPMVMRIPPFQIQILLESNPLKCRILVWRLAVHLDEIWLHLTSSAVSPKGAVRLQEADRILTRPELVWPRLLSRVGEGGLRTRLSGEKQVF